MTQGQNPSNRRGRRDREPAAPPTGAIPAIPGRAAAGPPGVPILWSALSAAALFLGYLLLTPPVSGDKDASEFTLALAVNGVIHPTGYPVYTLLGHWYTLMVHALGATWPFAANSWAGLGGATAMFLLHRLALRWIPESLPLGRTGRYLAALLPVALMGFNPIWTVETTLAEVYSWHLAWVCGTCVLFDRLLGQVLAPKEPGAPRLARMVAAWGVLCGLGGAHHVTAIFFAAPLSLGLLVALLLRHRFRAWMLPLLVAGAAVPLASYGIILYKAYHPTLCQWPTLEPSLRSVIDHMRGALYTRSLGSFNPSGTQATFLRMYVYPSMVPGLLALLAACALARGARDHLRWWSVAVGTGLQLAFNYNYGVGDPASYFLPCVAIALAALTPPVAAGATRITNRRLLVAGGLALAAAIVALSAGWVRIAAFRTREYVVQERLFRSMWLSIPVERGIVIWPDDMYYHLKEYQVFRHEKPGLDVFHTSVVCNEYPRSLFRKKYGFDPLARVHPGALEFRIPDEYIIGSQDPVIAHLFAMVHQTMVDSASVPIIAFEPEKPSVRVFERK